MKMKLRARHIQKLTGAKYMACLHELCQRGPLIGALRKMHPGMHITEADAAICFESESDLLKRWGEILFREAFGPTWVPMGPKTDYSEP